MWESRAGAVSARRPTGQCPEPALGVAHAEQGHTLASPHSSQEAKSWQLWLEEQQVTQPFKQAHREVYPLTEAEQATYYYLRRFAGHILRQHELNALARARDWRFSLHSNYSGSIRDDPASMEIHH